MGASYIQFKIQFKNKEDCKKVHSFFEYFSSNRKIDFDKKASFLKDLFSLEYYEVLKKDLLEDWFHEEDGSNVEKLVRIYAHLELEIQCVPSYTSEELAILIRRICLHFEVSSLRELDSTTKASGLCFIWLSEGQYFEYYDDQRVNFTNIDDISFDELFEFVEKEWRNNKIPVNLVKL